MAFYGVVLDFPASAASADQSVDSEKSTSADKSAGGDKSTSTDKGTAAELTNTSEPNLGDTSIQLDAKEADKLEALENHFFGRPYPHEPVERRILRLERFVFGTEYSGGFSGRLAKLAESLVFVEPDGTKRTVALTKPSPPAAPAAPAVSVPDTVTGNGGEAAATTGSDGAMPGLDAADASAAAPGKGDYIQKDYKSESGQSAGNDAPSIAPIVTMAVPNVTPPPPRAKQVVLHVTKESFPSEGKPQQLIKELTYAIKVHPLDPDLQFQRAKALIQIDKYDNALADLSDAIMNQPNKSDYYIARAWVYMKLGNSVLAADDIKQARFVDPGLPAKIDLSQPSSTSPSSSQ
jgi:hypothetical protein